MANDGRISMPGSFGGLMRYDEEYESKLKISASAVIGIVIAVIVILVALKIFFPAGA